MASLPPSAPLCACGTLAVWFPTTNAGANGTGAAATAAAATATTPAAASSLLGPAFPPLKAPSSSSSSSSSSAAAGQWLVGKKPATLTMSLGSGKGTGVLVQVHAGGRRLVALSAPWPATCGMVAPSTTTGEEETEDGNGGNENENGNEDPKNENSDGGCWIFVAGVRERPPPLYSSSLARESVQGGFLGPAVGEGKLLAKLAFRVDAASDGQGMAWMLRESCSSSGGKEDEEEEEEEAKERGRETAQAPRLTLSSPLPAAASLPPPAPDAAPIPHFLPQGTIGERKRAEGGEKEEEEAPEGNDLDLDLDALASLGDDEQLASLLEGMLREDALFRRVFERVDGAVSEALMASAAVGVRGAE